MFGKDTRRLARISALFCAGLVAGALPTKEAREKKGFKIISEMQKEASFLKNEKAIGLVDGAISLVIAAVVMGVGMMILGQVFPNIVGSDTASNASIAAMKTTTWSAMGLLPIGLTVFAAVVIIGIVMYLRQ